MKRRSLFNGPKAPVWLAAGGTVLILTAVTLLFAPPPPAPSAESTGARKGGNCYLLELRPGVNDRFAAWLDENDPALLVRADAARSAVRRLEARPRPEPPPPVWVRPEVMAFTPPPPDPAPLPLYAVTLPPPEPAVRRSVLEKPLSEPPLPRLRIGGREEALEMPEAEFAGAASNLVLWFPETGEGMRYRVVRSSGDAALDLRMVRHLLRRGEAPRGIVEVEWREER